MKVNTGDLLLFSNNIPTGFLVRTFTSSDWNHIGIAIHYRKLANGDFEIVEEGELCILETNACFRYDPIFDREIKGVGFSSIDYAKRKYNRIDVRKVDPNKRAENFHSRLKHFVKKFLGVEFPSEPLPFISVWLGIELSEREKKTAFCSEMVSEYIKYCYGGDSEELSEILGRKKLPNNTSLYTPGHYDQAIIPAGGLLGVQETIFVSEADLLYIIFQPLLILLVVVLILSMLFFSDRLFPITKHKLPDKIDKLGRREFVYGESS